MTALPQSASAGVALAEAALAEAALASVVALPSIVDSDPAPSPSIAVSDLALASIAVSDVGLASVVALPSIVALASIVDSDPAPAPSIAVSVVALPSIVALASTVDSVAGLASVDLVVDGRSTPTRPPARLPAALRLPAGSKGSIGMQWGEKRPAPYGTQAPASRPQGCAALSVDAIMSNASSRLAQSFPAKSWSVSIPKSSGMIPFPSSS